MKRLLLISLLFILTIQVKSQTLSAYVDFCRFKVNDSVSFVEIYIGIDVYSVKFENLSPNKYQAEVFASIQLSLDDKTTYFDKFNIQSPIVDSITGIKRFNFSKRIVTSNDLFDCELILKDQNMDGTPDTLNFDIENSFASKKVMFSDIQLLSDYKASTEKNDFTKNGFEMNPLTSNFYPNRSKSLKYYLEIYNLDKQIGKDEPLVIFTSFRDKNGRLLKELGRYKREKAQETIGLLSEIDISKLQSGNYFFIVELRDKENKLIKYTAKEIQRANTDFKESDEPTPDLLAKNFTNSIDPKDLQYFMQCLRPKAKKIEQSTIETLLKQGDSTESRQYFFNFWYKRYKDNAQREWLKYRKNIKQVDEEFSCFGRPGYLTEQGRVYLKYGAPNRVETEFTDPTRNAGLQQREYQIWQYYVLNDQRNKIFVFHKGNPGSCEFDLIHSTARDEIQNQDWLNNDNWREMLKRSSNRYTPGNNEGNYSTEF